MTEPQKPVATTPSAPAGAPPSPSGDFWRVAALVILLGVLGTLIGALTGEKTLFLLKEQLGLSASQVGTLNIILAIPAYLQPFVGAWTELIPFLGYHRRSYFVLGTLVGAGSFFGLAYLHQYHLVAVAGLLLVGSAGGIVTGVIINAVMVAVGNRTGSFARLQSISQFIPLVMAIVYTSHLGGYVTQHWSYHHTFWLAGLLTLLTVPVLPLVDDRRVRAARHASETAEAHAERLAERQAERARTQEALRQAARSPGLWAMVGYVFYIILTPGPNTAQVYYMTDVLHLSKQLIGDLGIYASIGSLIGIVSYGIASRWLPVRSLVWGAWLMDLLSYPPMLGIHNATTAIVMSLIGGFIGVVYGLCLYTLAARACPPGIEGTVFGLVMAAITLAGVLSDKMGSSLYDYFGPAHHYTIAHGWYTSLWIGLGFTALAMLFIPFLPAWARSKEPLQALSTMEGAAGD